MIVEKQIVEFMYWLAEKKIATIEEVLNFIESKGNKITFESFSHLLNYVWSGDFLKLTQISTGEEAWVEKELLENPQDFLLEFISFVGKDIAVSESFQGLAINESLQEIDECNYYLDLQEREFLQIFGEKDEAENLAERIRAFTNLFASTLARKDYQAVNTFVASAVQDKLNQDYFEKKLTKYEKRCGEIKLVDHVFPRVVYNGDFSSAKEMTFALPKGTDEASRRGSASFHLVSCITPNGVTLFSQELFIDVIEEEGRFKIINVDFIA